MQQAQEKTGLSKEELSGFPRQEIPRHMYYQILFQRILSQKPKVLVCINLYTRNDTSLSRMYMDFFDELKKMDAAVIIFSSGLPKESFPCDITYYYV